MCVFQSTICFLDEISIFEILIYLLPFAKLRMGAGEILVLPNSTDTVRFKLDYVAPNYISNQW